MKENQTNEKNREDIRVRVVDTLTLMKILRREACERLEN